MARKRRRSRLEIVIDILETVKAECKPPTRIATEANLAYDRMVKILEALVARGLVRENAGTFCISAEGLKLLESYSQWKWLLDLLGV